LEKRAWVNENSIELVSESTSSEMLRDSQETLGNERNYMRGFFQSPEGVAMLLQKSQLKDASSAQETNSGEILARFNALELRLEARLDRLERLLTAVLDERTNHHGRI
jgi:hypothetical protein